MEETSVRWIYLPMDASSHLRPMHPKWLNKAGVKTDFIRRDCRRCRDSHMMMLEENNDDVITLTSSGFKKTLTAISREKIQEHGWRCLIL